jgi:hypothetical protein
MVTRMVHKFGEVSVRQVPRALRIVYGDRRYLVAALVIGGGVAVLLGWGLRVAPSDPRSGLWGSSPIRLLEVVALAGTVAVIVPLQVFVLLKSRRLGPPSTKQVATLPRATEPTQDPASRTSLAPLLGGGVWVGLGIACLVCCAPLLLPALAALAGVSGSILVVVITHLTPWSGAITLGGLVLGGVAVLFLGHDVLAACEISPLRG